MLLFAKRSKKIGKVNIPKNSGAHGFNFREPSDARKRAPIKDPIPREEFKWPKVLASPFRMFVAQAGRSVAYDIPTLLIMKVIVINDASSLFLRQYPIPSFNS